MKPRSFCSGTQMTRLSPPAIPAGADEPPGGSCRYRAPLRRGVDGSSPIVVPKDSFVDYHVYSLHRREDIYGRDATEFRPERWETLQPGWGFLPFNAGPRGCVGRKLFALHSRCLSDCRWWTDTGCCSRNSCGHLCLLRYRPPPAELLEDRVSGSGTVAGESGSYVVFS